MKGIIYLIQPFEFLGTNVYKIGCSKKNNLQRCNSYKKGSRFLSIHECNNPYMIEDYLKKHFNKEEIYRQLKFFVIKHKTSGIYWCILWNFIFSFILIKEQKHIKIILCFLSWKNYKAFDLIFDYNFDVF